MPQPTITTALSFDDVLLEPGYADFTRDDTDISTKLTKNIFLEAPFVSAPMDTVTDARFAIALAKAGGIGMLHRNLRIEAQAKQVAEVKATGYRVGAATGVGEGYQERVAALAKAKVDVICIDAAHGYTDQMLDAVKYLKKNHPHIDVIAGNVATAAGADDLAKAGADAIRVGMGPGSICTTRVISGMGMPQLTAILETAGAASKYGVPVIADGGIKYSGDIVKALAAGASTVMIGSLFAATEEAPGDVVELEPEHVPSRFKSVFNGKKNGYRFKRYRGMGSEGAMKEGSKVNAEDEFHGKSFKDRVLVAEGVESLVPLKGSVQDVCDQAVGGIRSGMFYVGARTIAELQQKARFIQLTAASLRESHPHDVIITNPGDNY
jgi:IMP dehydrogenase